LVAYDAGARVDGLAALHRVGVRGGHGGGGEEAESEGLEGGHGFSVNATGGRNREDLKIKKQFPAGWGR
jgi:hypothetical protein